MKVKEHLEYISRIDLLEEDLQATKEELFDLLDEIKILKLEREEESREFIDRFYESVNLMDFVYWLRFTDRSGKLHELKSALEHYNIK